MLVVFFATAFQTVSALVVPPMAWKSLETLYPTAEHDERVRLGKLAQGLTPGTALRPHDKGQDKTYGEFSLESFGQCLSVAADGLEEVGFVDVGSGVGRLVLGAALIFPRFRQCHGLEISPVLHEDAVKRLQRAEAEGLVPKNRATFHLRDALDDRNDDTIFRDCNLFFIYATAFPAPLFSEELRAPLLNDEWTLRIVDMLTASRAPLCRVVTTDRALNPDVGFDLINVLPNLPNRETFGSSVYIHEFRPPPPPPR